MFDGVELRAIQHGHVCLCHDGMGAVVDMMSEDVTVGFSYCLYECKLKRWGSRHGWVACFYLVDNHVDFLEVL